MLRKLKIYYGSCTNEASLDSKGSKPLLDVVRQIRALFPLQATTPVATVKQSSQAVFAYGPKFAHELTEVLAYLHSLGTRNSPLDFAVYIINADQNISQRCPCPI